MKRPFLAETVRERVVKMLQNGYTYQQTADAFTAGVATVNRIWRRFRETGETSLPPRGGGKRPIIPQSQDEDFRAMVVSMPDATYDELTVAWRRRSKVKVSRAVIVRKVLQQGFSRKKKSKQATEKTTKKNSAKRSSFLFRSRAIPLEKLVFLDEAGFQASQDRTHARSLRGKKAICFSTSVPAYNITVAGAIRLTGPIVMQGMAKSMNINRFLSFLSTKLLPKLHPGDVLVMDNLRAHKNKAVRRLIRAWDVRVLYLPPYSPEYNPIEPVWGWMKQKLRFRIKRSFTCFRYAIAGAWRKTQNLCFSNLFRHCGFA